MSKSLLESALTTGSRGRPARTRLAPEKVIPIPWRRASIRNVSTAPTIRADHGGAARAPCSRRTVHGFAAALVTALFLAPAARGAGPARPPSQISVSLEYQLSANTSGCGDVNAFREAVQRQLGYDPFRAPADRRVTVRVSRSDTGYEGRIQWADARGRNVGERRLSTRRQGCTEILNNVAFAVAVQIQLLAAVAPPVTPPPREAAPTEPPGAPAGGAVASPSPTGNAETAAPSEATPPPIVTAPEPPLPPAPPAAPPAPPAPVAPAPRAEAARTLRLSLGLGPSLALALAPRPTASGRLFVDGRSSWLSVELSLDGILPMERQEASGTGFSFRRFDAEGAVCGHARMLAACVTAGLGYLQATGSGVDAPRSPSGFGAQAGGRVAVSQEFGTRYFATARAEGLIVLSRWSVSLNEVSVWSTPRLGALIGVDVGARLF